MSEDPIGFSGGQINTYNFISKNPIRSNDPYGMTQNDLDWAFSFAIDKYGPTPTYSFGSNMGTIQGSYDQTNNHIFINDKFKKDLCVSEAALLLTTVFHEVLHSKNQLLLLGDAVTPGEGRDNIFHEYIYVKSMEGAAGEVDDYERHRKR